MESSATNRHWFHVCLVFYFVTLICGQKEGGCTQDDVDCEKHSSLMDAKIYMIKMVDVIDERMNEKIKRYEDKITSLTQEIQILKENKAPKDTKGKRFLMVFPPLFYDQTTVYVKLFFVTNSANVICNVTVPNHNIAHNFVISDGYEELTMDKFLMALENVKGDFGVEIETSEEISLYAIKRDYFTRTAFLVLPVRSLSSQYLVTSIKPMPYNNGLHIYNSSVTVLSTSNNNYVNVKLGINGSLHFQGKSYSGGQFVRFRLNKYEHVVLSSHEHDFTGTTVTSADPVAVSVGNNCGRLYEDYACSGMHTMIPPISSLGRTYIVPSLRNQDHGFVARVVAAEDTTKLSVKVGNTEEWIHLDKQQYHDIVSTNNTPVYIESNSGILVTQITPGKSNADGVGAAFLMYIPAISQYQSSFHFAVPAEELSSHVSVIARDMSKIRLDDQPINIPAQNITEVEANEGVFEIAHVQIPSGDHVINDVDNRTLSVFLYGKRLPSLGYGYNVGYTFTP